MTTSTTPRTRKYFGTDGIRGVANQQPLDPESLVRLGKAIAKVFLKKQGKHRILIGKDTRLSGYMIETSLAAGITCMGADVLLSGPLPTPGVAYLTRSMRADAGIVISASHNPYEDNGIKIFGSDGFKLADSIEQELEGLMALGSLDHEFAPPSEIGKAFRIQDATGRYTVFLKGTFPRELSLEGLKLGVDCANGAAYTVAPQTFAELGAEVVSRGVSPNGRNINAGVGSLYPNVMAKVVTEQGLNAGITLDGDADRAILIDEKGGIMDGDVILALATLDLKERGLLKKPIAVSTVMANLGLEKFMKEIGVTLLRSAVGDRYVLEEMQRSSAQLGGEQSGHTIFAELSTAGDGIITALQVLALAARSGKPLSELSAKFTRFPQRLVNLAVSRKPPLESLPKFQQLLKQEESALAEKGRILVRYSGTENKVRVMVESDSEQRCDQVSQRLADLLQAEIGQPGH